MKNKFAIYGTMTALAVVAVLGWSIALHRGSEANAETGSKVDNETLEELYQAVFHRPADAEGRGYHLGRDLKQVLNDFLHSQENRYYGALFKAVKAYEEAQRAPGTLTEAEKKSYKDLIDSALSTLLAWVDTLPDRDPCRAIIGAEDARAAIQAAYDGMTPQAKAAAEKGIFTALNNLGRPANINIRNKCVKPTRSPSPTATPTATPTASPTETVTATPSPTPNQ